MAPSMKSQSARCAEQRSADTITSRNHLLSVRASLHPCDRLLMAVRWFYVERLCLTDRQ